jgi:hypothetical protein
MSNGNKIDFWMASKLHWDWVRLETIICNTEISGAEFSVVF